MTDLTGAPVVGASNDRKARTLPHILPSTDEGRGLFGGVVLVAVGMYLAWPPLAFIVPGALLIVFTLLPSRPEGDE